MILLIDNYDSFSYNLYQMVGSIDPDIKVIRNDAMTVDEIRELAPDRIILSPGPGRPEDAGICMEVVRELGGEIPILGVCLGHQAICAAYGGEITYASELMHGKQSAARFDLSCPLFFGCPGEALVGRYHSLAVEEDTLPESLMVTAVTPEGEVMAVKHKDDEVYGVQFHPESILTPDGEKILKNFLTLDKHAAESGQCEQRKETGKMIQEAIKKLADKKDLTYEEAEDCVNEIMDGSTSQVQTAAFLMGLAVKGETTDEIAAAAYAMRSHATPLHHEGEVFEIVGTGGDGSNTINVSTAAAFVVAAGGVPVAKHGNVAASSKSGAADCLEALGVNTRLEPAKMEQVLKVTGMAFMHAQVYHAAMKYVGPVRKEMGCHTIFNLLGPLTNPACNTMQVMGVYKPELIDMMADVLMKLGVTDGCVVYGQDGMDEISVSAPTTVCEFHDGRKKTYEITPEEFGITRAKKEDISGGDAAENAEVVRDVFSGAETGPKRDVIALNAGCGLYIAGKAASIAEGVTLAEDLIASGKAQEKLEEFVAATNE